MKKIILFIIVLPIILMSLNKISGHLSDPVDRLSSQISTSIAKKYGLRKCGMGGGADKQGVWLVKVEFERKGENLDIPTGRKLIIEIAEEFLKVINENKSIKSYLKNYPFTSRNISIGLYCYDFEGNDINDPYLDTLMVANGEVGFFTQDPEDSYKFKSEIYEPYDEALAKIKNNKDDGVQ